MRGRSGERKAKDAKHDGRMGRTFLRPPPGRNRSFSLSRHKKINLKPFNEKSQENKML